MAVNAKSPMTTIAIIDTMTRKLCEKGLVTDGMH
jgi:hypothetical protein